MMRVKETAQKFSGCALLIAALIGFNNSAQAAPNGLENKIRSAAHAAVTNNEDLTQLAGDYLISLARPAAHIVLADGHLILKMQGKPDATLENAGGRRYRMTGPFPEGFYLTFRAVNGNPHETEALLEQPRGQSLILTRVNSENRSAQKSWPAEAAELRGFYENSASKIAAKIKLEGDKATLKLPGQQPYQLVSETRGAYGVSSLPATFQLLEKRDGAGKLSGLTLQQPNGNIELSRVEKVSVPTQPPFILDQPLDWGTEHIDFPLSFAPSINYQGYEELRFSPDFAHANTEGHFSYLFCWIIDGQVETSAPQLQAQLEDYFRGLTAGMAESQGVKYDLASIHAKVTQVSANEYRASVDTIDPFATRLPVKLNVEISRISAPALKHSCLLFTLSPQPPQSRVWQQLNDMKRSFHLRSDQDPEFRS